MLAFGLRFPNGIRYFLFSRGRRVIQLRGFLLRLDLAPELRHGLGRDIAGVAEDVRMPANELGVDVPRHGLEIALASFVEQPGPSCDSRLSPSSPTQKMKAFSSLAALTLAVTLWLMRSRLGYAMRAIRNDEELAKLLSSTTIASGGVLPNIHVFLLPPKTTKP